MKQFKSLASQASDILKSFRDELERNQDEGRSKEWLQQANKATAEKYRQKLNDNATKRTVEVIQYRMDNIKQLEQVRKAGSSGDRVFHLQNAQAHLGGDLAKAVEVFPRLMNDSENRANKYIYEDYLLNRALSSPGADPVQFEEMLNKFRSEDEKQVRKRAETAEVLHAHAKTLDGFAELAFEDLEKHGQTTANLDLSWTWNELTKSLPVG